MTDLVRHLVHEAAVQFGMLDSEVLAPGKTKFKVSARWHVASELRRRGYSLPEIGRMMGGYHHTTIMNLLCARRYRHEPRPPLGAWDRDAPDLSGEWAI